MNISNSESFPVRTEQKMSKFWFEYPTVFLTANIEWKANPPCSSSTASYAHWSPQTYMTVCGMVWYRTSRVNQHWQQQKQNWPLFMYSAIYKYFFFWEIYSAFGQRLTRTIAFWFHDTALLKFLVFSLPIVCASFGRILNSCGRLVLCLPDLSTVTRVP